MDITLTKTEFVELKYLQALGYLVRDEIGKTVVFREKPYRKNDMFCLNYWFVTDSNEYELNPRNRRKTELATYEFIQFEDDPLIIKDIIKEYKIIKV